MEIYISGRQFGKTTMLIKESARTGATIAVATYQMAQHVLLLAEQMGLEIPQPVTYANMFKTHAYNRTKRYLVDELQTMLSQLNVDIATVDLDPIRYLNHWKYPDGYRPRLIIYDENPIHIQREAVEKLMCQKVIEDSLSESFKKHFFREMKGENNND